MGKVGTQEKGTALKGCPHNNGDVCEGRSNGEGGGGAEERREVERLNAASRRSGTLEETIKPGSPRGEEARFEKTECEGRNSAKTGWKKREEEDKK